MAESVTFDLRADWVRRHGILIPHEQFSLLDGSLVLVGIPKALIKALCPFACARE